MTSRSVLLYYCLLLLNCFSHNFSSQSSSSSLLQHENSNNNHTIQLRNYNDNVAQYSVETIIGFPSPYYQQYIPSGYPASYYWGLSIGTVVVPYNNDGQPILENSNEIYLSSEKYIFKYSRVDGLLHKLTFTREEWYKIRSMFVVQKESGENLIYVTNTDMGSSTVYLANEKSGISKRIAGKESSSGYNGNGLLAIESSLNNPNSVFVKNEEVFICDTENNLIRKIDKEGRLWNVFPDSLIKRPSTLTILNNFDMIVSSGFGIKKVFQNMTVEQLFSTSSTDVPFTVFENEIYVARFNQIVRITGEYSFETVLKLENVYPNRFLMTNRGRFIISFGGVIQEYDVNNNNSSSIIGNRLLIGCNNRYPQYYTLPANISQLQNIDSILVLPSTATGGDDSNGGSILFTEHSSSFIRQYFPNRPLMGTFDQFSDISFITKHGNKFYAIANNNIFVKGISSDSNFTQLSGLLTPVNVPDNIGATMSTLNNPRGIFLKNQNLFIADSANHRIRKIDLTTGIISSIAGNGKPNFSGDGQLATTASLNSPSDVYVSDSGLIYISDTNNHVIRLINSHNDNIISTFAGTGLAGFSGDNNLATNATLNKPYGIVETSSGSLIICDSGNERLRKVSNNIISTIAGDGTKGFRDGFLPEALFNNPTALFYSHPMLYISDTDGQRIRLANLESNTIKTIAGNGNPGYNGDNIFPANAQLNNPQSVCISKNILYISDTDNKKIRKIDSNLLFSLDIPFENPKGLTCDDNFLYVNDGNTVKKIDLVDYSHKIVGGGIGDGWYLESALLKPMNLVFDDEENIYFVDTLSNRIRKSDATGIVSTVAGSGGLGFEGDGNLAINAKLFYPKSISVSNKKLYICDSGNSRIRKVDLTTGIITTIAGTGIKGYSGDGGLAIDAKLYEPSHMVVNSEEEIFLTDYSSNTVRKITRNGFIFRIAGSQIGNGYNGDSYPALETQFSAPKLITLDSNGHVILFDSNNQLIRRLNPHCGSGYYLEPETNSSCIPICFQINGQDSKACSSHGSCQGPNQCECEIGYTGSSCSDPVCFSKSGNDACGGPTKGACIGPNQCMCSEHYSGIDCSTPRTLLIVLGVSTICVVLCIVLCITVGSLMFVRIQIQKKKRMIIKTDQLLDKRFVMDDFGSLDSFSSNAANNNKVSDFVIPLEQLNMDHPIKRIGEGGFSRVFSTKWGNKIVAVKVMDLNDFDLSEETFTQEFQILVRLRHPNIVSFYGISFSPSKRYIVMELCEHSLEHVIHQLQNRTIEMNLHEKIDILIDIIEGVNYLHNLNPKCLHRDLKPLNILATTQKTYKLCDFGVGKILNSQKTVTSITNNIGTCYYMSPETTGCDNSQEFESVICATSIDIYSFAIVFWQLLFEVKDPFVSCAPSVLDKLRMDQPLQLNSMYHLHRLIVEKNLRPTIPFSSQKECENWCKEFLSQQDVKFCNIFYEMCQLMKLCWDKKPNKRPDAKTILERLQGWKEEIDNDVQ